MTTQSEQALLVRNAVIEFDNTFIWITRHNKKAILDKIKKMFKELKSNINASFDREENILLFQRTTYSKTLKVFERDINTFFESKDFEDYQEIDLDNAQNIFKYKDNTRVY